MSPKCWNEKMQSIPATRVVLQEAPTNVNTMDIIEDLGPIYTYECNNPKYPYQNYNDAAGVHNMIELRRRFTHDSHHIRNPIMHKQTQLLEDKHKIGVERIRLKEGQIATLNKVIFVFGIIYYIMVGLIGVRIFLSSTNKNPRFIIIVILLLLLFLALPLLAGHIARGSYLNWKHVVSDKYKTLGIRPEIHPHSEAGSVVTGPYMNAQKRAAHMMIPQKTCKSNQEKTPE